MTAVVIEKRTLLVIQVIRHFAGHGTARNIKAYLDVPKTNYCATPFLSLRSSYEIAITANDAKRTARQGRNHQNCVKQKIQIVWTGPKGLDKVKKVIGLILSGSPVYSGKSCPGYSFSGRKVTGNINDQVCHRRSENLERAIRAQSNRDMAIEYFPGLII